MQILNKLTLKHLKMNKKRTLVTIIGIILSTSLMVGLGLLISSFRGSMLEGAKKDFGSYHANFNDLSKNEFDILSKNINVTKLYYYKPVGFSKTDSGITSKPYLYIVDTDDSFLNNLTLIDGAMPKNANEIVVSKSLVDYNSSYKIGDTLNLDIGTRYYEGYEMSLGDNSPVPISWDEDNPIYQDEEIIVKTKKAYKIVGVVEDTIYEDYYSAGIMAFSLNKDISSIYNVYVEYKNPRNTYKYTEEIIKNLNIEDSDYKVNTNLLYYYGATKYDNINNTILPLMIIALSVISIGCIIVIYNSFAISTTERKKSFGLYASIGATMKQIKHTVLFEAVIVGIIGIILGILGGFLGIYILIQVLNHLLEGIIVIYFIVEPLYIIIPLIFMIIVIFISAYLPAKRSSKVAPIEAIRGNDDIKIGKKDIKTPRFISKIFGIEGVIAFKNIKRNKKKYRITIISLFISIVMFNTFTSFLSYFTKASDTTINYDYDIAVNLNGNDDDVKKDIEAITKKYDYDNLMVQLYTFYSHVGNLTVNDFTNYFDTSELEDLSFYTIVIDDNIYNKLTKEEAILLNNKYIYNIDENNRKVSERKIFTKDYYNLNLTLQDKEVKLKAKVTNDDIYGFRNYKNQNSPIMIVSESIYKNRFVVEENLNAKVMISSKDYKKLYDDLEDKKISLNSDDTSYFSPALDEISKRNLIIAINILFYGFISLITLIGITSVINTINTNMNLRRKEFAMLRSIGLTPKGFNKLLFFESLFFGLKALIYGIPVSIFISLLIALAFNNMLDTSLIIPWKSIIISIIVVFIVVLIAMNYATKKIKKENILGALREENI